MGSSVSCLEEEDLKDVTWTRTEFLGGEKSGTTVPCSEANGMNTRCLDEKIALKFNNMEPENQPCQKRRCLLFETIILRFQPLNFGGCTQHTHFRQSI